MESRKSGGGHPFQSVVGLVCAGVGLVLGLACFGIVWPTCTKFWSFDHIEQQAKRVITPAELQVWGTNLLVHPPATSTPRLKDLGTNFPKKLLTLWQAPPQVCIYESTTNEPGWVKVTWGGGMIGHCGFEIGPTNFAGRPGYEPWQGQKGVYFWTDRKQ